MNGTQCMTSLFNAIFAQFLELYIVSYGSTCTQVALTFAVYFEKKYQENQLTEETQQMLQNNSDFLIIQDHDLLANREIYEKCNLIRHLQLRSLWKLWKSRWHQYQTTLQIQKDQDQKKLWHILDILLFVARYPLLTSGPFDVTLCHELLKIAKRISMESPILEEIDTLDSQIAEELEDLEEGDGADVELAVLAQYGISLIVYQATHGNAAIVKSMFSIWIEKVCDETMAIFNTLKLLGSDRQALDLRLIVSSYLY